MACGCSPCTCGGCAKYTVLSGSALKGTLARCLIPVVDSLRDLRVKFGLRPYLVRIIRTKWTVDERGEGVEFVLHEFPILPTPRVSDLTALTTEVQSIGLDESGSVLLTEVSGRYTEDQLRGLDVDGSPVPDDENIFYEIEFPRVDGKPSERRRFVLRSAPTYLPGEFQWQLRLEQSHEARGRSGEPR